MSTYAAPALRLRRQVDRRTVLQLVGETMREIGALAVLFAPLDSTMSDHPFASDVLIVWILGGIAMIACGILLTAKNQ